MDELMTEKHYPLFCGPKNPRTDTITEGETSVQTQQKVKKPQLYKVILHNDHYTTMDFVVEVLVKVFHKSASEATMIMLEVHKKGMGICGVYTLDIARTKVDQVHMMAKAQDFPLKCSYEEA